MLHLEKHRTERIGWLRAAELGANDGIVSIASLIIGVASSNAARADVFIAGGAGLVAGAISMAAGEFISVSSQADSERAEITRERRELELSRDYEMAELSSIYVKRGLKPQLAKQVAQQLMEHDALAAHTRDELGISEQMSAKPIQAALVSAASFTLGAALPLSFVLLSPEDSFIIIPIAFVSLLSLVFLGALAAYTGGSSKIKSIARVAFWGMFAMGLTAIIGAVFGQTV